MFSHSLGGALGMWDASAMALASDFRVLRYDSRGHGASGVPVGPYSIHDLGRDALAVLDAVGLESVHFVGLSQGGMTGMWLAIHAASRIDKLVLANTTAFIANKAPWDGLIETALREGLGEIAPRTIHGWLGTTYKAADPDGTAALVERMRSMSPVGYAGAAAVLRDVDLRAGLAGIKAQTLVIAGIEDGERGSAAAEALVHSITGAKRADLPAAAHLSCVENPSAFNKTVLDFLENDS
jgi:3-oxoadipate enol-lactonase